MQVTYERAPHLYARQGNYLKEILMRAACFAFVLIFSAAFACAQNPPTGTPPSPPAHHHGMGAMHDQHMQEMKSQVEQMRATLEKMKSNLAKVKDPAIKQQSQPSFEHECGANRSRTPQTIAFGFIGFGLNAGRECRRIADRHYSAGHGRGPGGNPWRCCLRLPE